MTKLAMNIKDAAFELEKSLDQYDWFICTEIAPNNAITVYVQQMGREVCDVVPDRLYGYQITLGYEAHLNCQEKYGVIHLDLGADNSTDLLKILVNN